MANTSINAPAAERAAIAALLLDRGIINDSAAPRLCAEDFASPLCKALFGSIAAGTTSDAPGAIDIIAPMLPGGAEEAHSWVKAILDLTPTRYSYPAHAKAVHTAGVYRRMAAAINDALASLADPRELASRLREIANDADNDGLADTEYVATSQDAVVSYMSALGKGLTAGCSTGIAVIDDVLGKMKPGELVVLAATPGGGKSAFAQQVATYVVRNEKREDGTPKGAMISSMEMSRAEMVERAISAASGIDLAALAAGKISPEDFSKIGDAANLVASDNIIYVDAPRQSVDSIAYIARKNKSKIDIIIVDYLGLLDLGLAGDKNPVEALENACKALKALAGEMQVPVVLLSQYSREGAKSGLPNNYHLRGSGGIEATANKIIHLSRESAVTGNDSPNPDGSVRICLQIGKNRGGKITAGTPIMLDFFGATMTFRGAFDPTFRGSRNGRERGFLGNV